MTTLGVVTIGRNEGARLQRCLRSLRSLLTPDTPVVYVDSGSTDDSVAYARSLRVDVVELDMSVPFTMARGRNAGFRHLLERHPQLKYVQFLDGDCELLPGWIEAGIAALDADDDLAVVSGRRRERHLDVSIYNRLADMEWDTPVGEARYCHGDALMRVAALLEVGLFNPTLIAGEEPELCVRLRAAGWRIRRIDHDMTLHDAAMTHIRQWWNRCVRGGWAYAQGAAMHGQSPERHKLRESRSVWLWGLILPVTSLTLVSWTNGWSLVALAMYPFLLLRIAIRHWHRGYLIRDALLYATFNVLAKFPQAVGQMRYWFHRVSRQPARLIEYKPAEQASC